MVGWTLAIGDEVASVGVDPPMGRFTALLMTAVLVGAPNHEVEIFIVDFAFARSHVVTHAVGAVCRIGRFWQVDAFEAVPVRCGITGWQTTSVVDIHGSRQAIRSRIDFDDIAFGIRYARVGQHVQQCAGTAGDLFGDLDIVRHAAVDIPVNAIFTYRRVNAVANAYAIDLRGARQVAFDRRGRAGGAERQ